MQAGRDGKRGSIKLSDEEKQAIMRRASLVAAVDPAEDTRQTLLMKRIQNAGPDGVCAEMVDKTAKESLDVRDRWGNTALHYAAVWGCPLTAEQLLRAGADPRARTLSGGEYRKVGGSGVFSSDGPTALELAAIHGHEAVMTALLHQPGAVPPEELLEALYAAAQHGVIIQALLDEGRFDEAALATALAVAVRNGREAAALTLIGDGALLQLPVDLTLAVRLHEAVKGAPDAGARDVAKAAAVVAAPAAAAAAAAAADESSSDGGAAAAAVAAAPEVSLTADVGDFHWAAGETVGSRMLMIALTHDVAHLPPRLIAKGAPPGFVDYLPRELHVETTTLKQPFGLALKREAFAEAIRMLPAGFLRQPGAALYAGLCVSEAAQTLATQLRVLNPPRARALRRHALEAELTTLALLHTLPEVRQVDLLRSAEGEDYLRLAARLDSTAVLSQPIVQENMKARWLGGFLHGLLHGRGVNAWGDRIPMRLRTRLALALVLPLVLALNLLLLPLVAVAPRAERAVLRALGRVGVMGEADGKLRRSGFSPALGVWTADLWLLGVPLVKSSMCTLSNIALALLLLLDASPSWLTLAWAASLGAHEAARVAARRPFITWAAWMLIVASALLALGAGLDLARGGGSGGSGGSGGGSGSGGAVSVVGGDLPPDETARGFLSLGLLIVLLNVVALLFLQSSFLGPMVTSIQQMLSDALSWMITLLAGAGVWMAAFYVHTAAAADDGGGGDTGGEELVLQMMRYLVNLGLKVSPLMGATPLIVQAEQDPFEYALLLSYFTIVSVMLYSMLTALFATRLAASEAKRIPKFHLSFCKLVLNEHTRPAAPPPLALLSLLEPGLDALLRLVRSSSSSSSSPSSRLGRGGGGGGSSGESQQLERSTTRSLFKFDSTPEKTWHTADYFRAHPPTELLASTLERVEQELLKLEGPLMALTSDTKFKGMHALLARTSDEVRKSVEEGVDMVSRRVQGLREGVEKDLHRTVYAIKPDAAAMLSLVAPPPPGAKSEEDKGGSMSERRAVAVIERRLVERLTQRWRRTAEHSERSRHVRMYKGFSEAADRLIFPYGLHAARFGEGQVATHMTILSNGKIENPAKRLWLTGQFTPADRPELERLPDKELFDMLKKRLPAEEYQAVRAKAPDRAQCVDMLMGMERETELDQRALCAFPFLQSMSQKDANAHRGAPNNVFVRRRDNGSWGVTHCWPVKYNEAFKRQFEEFRPFFAPQRGGDARRAVDPSRFSPRAATEFKECMERLFGARLSGDVEVVFASKTMQNPHLALVGTAEDIVRFLRVRPALQKHLGIVKMQPDGFTARVTANGKFVTFKQFGMARDGTAQVAYIKAGYETMACVKPLELFEKDCRLGAPLDVDGLAAYLQSAAQPPPPPPAPPPERKKAADEQRTDKKALDA